MTLLSITNATCDTPSAALEESLVAYATLRKEMDRIRRGKRGVIFLPDIDEESSAYKLGDGQWPACHTRLT
jgi:hypothetical protein